MNTLHERTALPHSHVPRTIPMTHSSRSRPVNGVRGRVPLILSPFSSHGPGSPYGPNDAADGKQALYAPSTEMFLYRGPAAQEPAVQPVWPIARRGRAPAAPLSAFQRFLIDAQEKGERKDRAAQAARRKAAMMMGEDEEEEEKNRFMLGRKIAPSGELPMHHEDLKLPVRPPLTYRTPRGPPPSPGSPAGSTSARRAASAAGPRDPPAE
ncbi:hypothetical protein PAPYR_9267 [Paratrimastix pyriformis]|uniref:Uncharacterized protein n=1 Tax=Paratrimastix pyriformis TaxID=342808 RepID=A0ABQ8U8T6_9EUKA|nr:hypothetical protein PAPYR_9267 [Paratrimastix pyriformis]